MNIYKHLNLQSKTVRICVERDINVIMDRCDVIAKSEYLDVIENKVAHDGQCPKCRNKKNIVDKMCNVHGNLVIKGTFNLGFGSVTGTMNINTSAVNHCNDCGNEWVKFNDKYVSATDIARVALNYLAQIITNPDEKKCSWKVDAIKVFDGCCAEAICKLRSNNEKYLHDKTLDVVKLSIIRKYYNSIYDVELIKSSPTIFK